MNQYERALDKILGFESNCKGFIIDPLYGQVPITEQERRVIDTDIFKRLSRIKQLGAASRIYPGANHTRFEHSIGVLFTTWEIFKKFIINTSKHPQYLYSFQPKSLDSEVFLRSLRLAALLHDIGHGPFSHTLERCFSRCSAFSELKHGAITLFLLSHGLDEALKPSKNKEVQELLKIVDTLSNFHNPNEIVERLKKCRRQLSERIKDTRIQRYILFILNDQIEFSDFKVPEYFSQVRQFAHDLISGDIGSDRIDYLLRDTYFTGLGHRFNLSQILDSVVGIFDKNRSSLIFSIDFNAKNAIEFFLTTRYYHYRLIAHHLSNLDHEFELCKKIGDINLKEENPTLNSLDMATKDDVYVNSKIDQFGSDEFERVFTSNLRSIKNNLFRFFLYRIVSDHDLQREYFDLVRDNLFKKMSRHGTITLGLQKNDIFVEATLENPNIPIIHTFREKYAVEKEDAREFDSVLFHDSSELVMALARSYLLDTLLAIYVPKKFKEKIGMIVSSSHDFYMSKKLFRNFLSTHLCRETLNRFDILLFALLEGTDNGAKNLVTIKRLFELVDSLQEKVGKEFYDTKEYQCFDPEDCESFHYCKSVLNDLFLFVVSDVIRLEVKNMSKRVEGKWAIKPKYEINPVKYLKKGEMVINLIESEKYYPLKIRQLLS